MRFERPCFFSMSILFLLSGCNPAGELATVQCRVTTDGRPLSGAEMNFDSVGDDAVSIVGVTLADGTCYLDIGERAGLPTGNYTIAVTVYETDDGEPLPGGEEGQARKLDGSAIRKQYVVQRLLHRGTNSFELRIEDAQEIALPDDPEPDPTE